MSVAFGSSKLEYRLGKSCTEGSLAIVIWTPLVPDGLQLVLEACWVRRWKQVRPGRNKFKPHVLIRLGE